MTYKRSFSKGKVSITEWENNLKDAKGFFSSFTLQKSFTDESGEWKNTNTFSENDLKDALILLNHVLNNGVKERGETSSIKDEQNKL